MKIEQVIGKPYFKIDRYRYNDESLAAMSLEELKILKSQIESKVQILAAQMKAKKIDYAGGGEGSTREWFVNHKYALDVNSRMLPFVAGLIRQRNRDERSLSDYFVDEARIYLDKGTFDTIMRNAEREKNILTRPDRRE
jgi:hypothetical protein